KGRARRDVAVAVGESRVQVAVGESHLYVGNGLQAVPIRLRARLPVGARQVTWSWSLVYGSYPVVFQRSGDDRDVTEWLQGTETSAPFRLAGEVATPSRMSHIARDVALGFTHILPNGLDHILFVLGLF